MFVISVILYHYGKHEHFHYYIFIHKQSLKGIHCGLVLLTFIFKNNLKVARHLNFLISLQIGCYQQKFVVKVHLRNKVRV